MSRGGEDKVTMGLGVDWGDGVTDLIEALSGLKEAAAMRNVDAVPFDNGQDVYLVRRRGFGGSGGGPHYSYALAIQGILFGVCTLREPKGEIANVRCEVSSLTLMELGGLHKPWDMIRAYIRRLGGRLLWSKISRVDLCVDLPGLAVDEFYTLFQRGQYITRGRSWDEYSEVSEHGMRAAVQGFAIGRKRVRMTIYDKLRESMHDARKRAVLVAKRWDCLPPCATRVEFQVKRDMLKEFRIDSVDDYLRKRGMVARYLTREWFRFTESVISNEHHSRVSEHELWIEVREAFEEWTGDDSVREPGKFTRVSAHDLYRQALGCCATAVAMEMDGEILEYDDFVAEVTERLFTICGKLDIGGIQAEKCLKWVSEGPSGQAA